MKHFHLVRAGREILWQRNKRFAGCDARGIAQVYGLLRMEIFQHQTFCRVPDTIQSLALFG